MITRHKSQLILLTALVTVGLSFVALATGGASARPTSASSGAEPTHDQLAPVWVLLAVSKTAADRARVSIGDASKATANDRIRSEQDAVEAIGLSLHFLAEINLPPVLDSPFMQQTLRDIENLEKGAKRSVTTVRGLRTAERALEKASILREKVRRYVALTVSRITATFVKPVTTYHAHLFDPGYFGSLKGTDYLKGQRKFKWSNSNDCGDFAGEGDQAKWSHLDSNAPGACPAQAVHPGTITVIVTTQEFTCAGAYPNGSAAGKEDSPAEKPCTVS